MNVVVIINSILYTKHGGLDLRGGSDVLASTGLSTIDVLDPVGTVASIGVNPRGPEWSTNSFGRSWTVRSDRRADLSRWAVAHRAWLDAHGANLTLADLALRDLGVSE